MVKVKIRTGRGTGTIEVDVEDLKFSGDEFKKKQQVAEWFHLEEVLGEENYQIFQNLKKDHLPKEKLDLQVEAQEPEKVLHSISSFEFYFLKYFFKIYYILISGFPVFSFSQSERKFSNPIFVNGCSNIFSNTDGGNVTTSAPIFAASTTCIG